MTPQEFIVGFVFPHECAYLPGTQIVAAENVEDDGGGLTKYGIDRRAHPGVDIRNLTATTATAIYLDEFHKITFRGGDCDGEAAMTVFPGDSFFAFFDTSVLYGVTGAWKMTQRAVGVVDDGAPGPRTRAAILRTDGAALVAGILNRRRVYTRDIVRANPRQEKFLKGWNNRTDDLEKFLST